MGKVIKNNPKKVVSAFDFKMFKTVERGVNSFEVKTFSSVEKGVKKFNLEKLKIKKKLEKKDIEEKKEELAVENEELISEEEQQSVVDEKLLEETNKKSFEEGYKQGFEAAKIELNKSYEAQKADYLNKLDKFFEDASQQLREIKDIFFQFDKDIPELVLKFIKEIIGCERKINDEIIISAVKAQLERFNELEDLTFIINPEDEELFQKHFTFYNMEKDPSVLKGGVIIKTKVGEVEISIDKLVEDFTTLLNEKFGIS